MLKKNKNHKTKNTSLMKFRNYPGHTHLSSSHLSNLCFLFLVSVQKEPGSLTGLGGGSVGTGVDPGAVRARGLCVRPQTLGCQNPFS